MADEILDGDLKKNYTLPDRRRKLLPFWIKFFCWMFMFTGAIVPLIFIFGLFTRNTHLEIFGFETNDPYTGIGVLVSVIFLLKGIVGYGLWFEKIWAVRAAIADGFTSIGVCIIQMILNFAGTTHFTFRFEILLLILYLMKLKKILYDWENGYELT
jgi:hypothetical protein